MCISVYVANRCTWKDLLTRCTQDHSLYTPWVNKYMLSSINPSAPRRSISEQLLSRGISPLDIKTIIFRYFLPPPSHTPTNFPPATPTGTTATPPPPSPSPPPSSVPPPSPPVPPATSPSPTPNGTAASSTPSTPPSDVQSSPDHGYLSALSIKPWTSSEMARFGLSKPRDTWRGICVRYVGWMGESGSCWGVIVVIRGEVFFLTLLLLSFLFPFSTSANASK